MVGGLIAANSSTDPDAPELGRVVPRPRLLPPVRQAGRRREALRLRGTGRDRRAVLLLRRRLVFLLDTAQDNFNLMLQIGAGTGLLYLVRWFWWRVNAWCEIVAMISSFGIAVFFAYLRRTGMQVRHARGIADRHPRSRPSAGWPPRTSPRRPTARPSSSSTARSARSAPAGRPSAPRPGSTRPRPPSTDAHENMPLALLGWVSGCVVIWSALFAVGNYLYGRDGYALGLLAVFVASGLVLIGVIRQAVGVNGPGPGIPPPSRWTRNGRAERGRSAQGRAGCLTLDAHRTLRASLDAVHERRPFVGFASSARRSIANIDARKFGKNA